MDYDSFSKQIDQGLRIYIFNSRSIFCRKKDIFPFFLNNKLTFFFIHIYMEFTTWPFFLCIISCNVIKIGDSWSTDCSLTRYSPWFCRFVLFVVVVSVSSLLYKLSVLLLLCIPYRFIVICVASCCLFFQFLHFFTSIDADLCWIWYSFVLFSLLLMISRTVSINWVLFFLLFRIFLFFFYYFVELFFGMILFLFSIRLSHKLLVAFSLLMCARVYVCIYGIWSICLFFFSFQSSWLFVCLCCWLLSFWNV